jgi:plastocyanin
MNARTIAPALAALAGAAVLAVPAGAKTFQIDVTVTNASCKLALTAANTPNTAIDFHVINNGTIGHGIMVWGVKSSIFDAKREGDLLVNFHKPGTYHYACTAGSYKHPKLFGKGVFTIRS